MNAPEDQWQPIFEKHQALYLTALTHPVSESEDYTSQLASEQNREHFIIKT